MVLVPAMGYWSILIVGCRAEVWIVGYEVPRFVVVLPIVRARL